MLEGKLEYFSHFKFNTMSFWFFVHLTNNIQHVLGLRDSFNSWGHSSEQNRLNAALPSWCLPFKEPIEFEKQVE